MQVRSCNSLAGTVFGHGWSRPLSSNFKPRTMDQWSSSSKRTRLELYSSTTGFLNSSRRTAPTTSTSIRTSSSSGRSFQELEAGPSPLNESFNLLSPESNNCSTGSPVFIRPQGRDPLPPIISYATPVQPQPTSRPSQATSPSVNNNPNNYNGFMQPVGRAPRPSTAAHATSNPQHQSARTRTPRATLRSDSLLNTLTTPRAGGRAHQENIKIGINKLINEKYL